MTLEETTQLYASVLRQLLPTGGYDTSPNTEALAVDVYAHAKLLAQADLDGKRLLKVLEELPPELLPEYETEYGLPLKCTVNASKTLEERLEILKWVRSTNNVLNRAYLKQILAIFGVELFELRKYTPMQCTAPCNAPVNTEQLRYKVRIVIPDTTPADMDCIIENYLPGYLRIDVLKVPLLFKTSKQYPYIVEENLEHSITFQSPISLRTVMKSTASSEMLTHGIQYGTPILRSVLRGVLIESESLSHGLIFSSFRLQSVHKSYVLQPESIKSDAMKFSEIKLQKVLISIPPLSEKCTHGLVFKNITLA